MSDPENFLSRWSRRKRDAVTSDQVAPAPADRSAQQSDASRNVEGVQAADSPASSAAARSPERRARQADDAPADLAKLPDIDSITADTDISGFLQPGVPEDLRRAALRRAWAADPKIWNYIEGADYDWDFNAPGAAAGFGPLDMTDGLRREVARLLGDAVPETEPEAQTGAPVPQPADPVEQVQAIAPPAEPDGQAAQVESGAAVEESQFRENPERPEQDHIAAQQEPAPSQNLRSFARRNHGGALPK